MNTWTHIIFVYHRYLLCAYVWASTCHSGGQCSFQLLTHSSFSLVYRVNRWLWVKGLPQSLTAWVVLFMDSHDGRELTPSSRTITGAFQLQNLWHAASSSLTSNNPELPLCNHVISGFRFTNTLWIYKRLLEEGLWSWKPKKIQLITPEACQRYHGY